MINAMNMTAAELFWAPRESSPPAPKERPRRVAYEGSRVTIKEAAAATGLSVYTIRQRLKQGDTDEEALRPRLSTYRPKAKDWDTGPTVYQLRRIARRMYRGARLTLPELRTAAKIASDAQTTRIVRYLVRLGLVLEESGRIESTPKGFSVWRREKDRPTSGRGVK